MLGGKKSKKHGEDANVTAVSAATIWETGASEAGKAVILMIGGDAAFGREVAGCVTQGARAVVFAASGAEAEKLAREHPVVLIVMRAVLPDLDARDLFTRLREDPRTAAIPVLFLGERLNASVRQHACRTPSDGDLEGAPSAADVAAWIGTRLRRDREVTRDARRDPLTGLPSRAAFVEEYGRLAAGCQEDQESMVLALIAADSRGAGGGRPTDDTLVRLASTLSACLRATDAVARWGTEEFAILLPGEHQAGGQRALEKILAAWRKQDATITISAGLTTVDPTVSADAAVLDAGRHLRDARAAGGNRVVTTESRPIRRRDRVLLVVHDKVIAKVLLNLMAREDMRPVLVDSADDAMKTCSGRIRFRLIVIDEKLPDKDGFATVELIRGMHRNHNVPVVMLLGSRSEAQVTRALKMGVSDYTVRPFDPVSFVSRMRELMSRETPDEDAAPEPYRVAIIDEDSKVLILAGTALHRCGGIEVCLCLGVEDARQRLREESPDVVVAALPMLAEGPKGLQDLLGTPAAENELAIVAIAKDAPADPKVLAKLGCRGALTLPLNPMTLGADVMRLTGITINEKAVVPDGHLSTEIHRAVRAQKP